MKSSSISLQATPPALEIARAIGATAVRRTLDIFDMMRQRGGVGGRRARLTKQRYGDWRQARRLAQESRQRLRATRARQLARQRLHRDIRFEIDFQRGPSVRVDRLAQRRGQRIDGAAFQPGRRYDGLAAYREARRSSRRSI